MPAALLASSFAASTLPAEGLVPGASDFRVQKLERAQGETNWPFTARKGLLMCVPSLSNKLVYFVPENDRGENEYPVNIDSNAMSMAMVNIGRGGAFRPFADFEELMNRLSPYITMGKRLCDQPAGTVVPESSL
ncbi:hypothetical protein G6L28_15760 [Agrobacterium larrymoorei]|uniref:hypothetical protein n=1 Tax=Agrobacterium larrymoorei TaxID=160699 RepID=UPI00191F5223|nr:hypothetical protein [Agrobacterium larrymoorei]NTJ44057.1 hypothetical protein [Agrobacterium larrymoorei]